LEDVSVRANLCDWESATKNSDFGGQSASAVGAGVLGGVAVGAIGSIAGASLTIGPTFAGLAFCPVCLGIGIAIAIAMLIINLFDDPCDEYRTNVLKDYVINLAGTNDPEHRRYVPPDALAILMSDNRISGEWNVDVTDVKADSGINGRQTVGVVFKNLNAIQDEPIYAIVTMSSKEHVHGDPTHQNSSVSCRSGNFGMFWINPETCSGAYDTQYNQKFHLKFKVAEELETLPQVNFDTFACQTGVTIGRTGPGALPRTKLNWSWKESSNGITSDQCDALNPDFVYCDATQFTIEISKKVNILYEFLRANNFDFGCPTVLVNGQPTQFICDLKTTETYFEEPILITGLPALQPYLVFQRIVLLPERHYNQSIVLLRSNK